MADLFMTLLTFGIIIALLLCLLVVLLMIIVLINEPDRRL